MKYIIYFLFSFFIIYKCFKNKNNKDIILLSISFLFSLICYYVLIIFIKIATINSLIISFIIWTLIYQIINLIKKEKYHFSSFILLSSYFLSINQNILNLNVSRFIFISFIFLIPYFYIRYKLYRYEKNINDKIERIIKLVGLFLIIIFLIVSFTKTNYYYLKYPLNYDDFTIAKNPYALLFEGFQDGHLYLKIKPDAKLATLINPYAGGSRKGINYLWDFAYYNEHYYVYFGVAPVILIYYPIYFLSFGNYIPQYEFVNNICAIVCLIYGVLALYRVYKNFSYKINIFLFIICAFTLFIGGGYLYLSLAEPMYNTPILFGLSSLYALIYYCFKGVKENSKLSFALMGLSFIFIMASRPNLSLAIIPLLAILLPYLFKNFTKHLLNFIPCFSVLIGGFILIGFYNYFRFGSFLDFGANYQLTVSDVSKNKILIENFKPAMYYYLIQPFKIQNTFPYLKITSLDIKEFNLSHYTYVYPTFGIFMVPLSLFVFGGLFNIKNKKHLIFNSLVILFLILLSFLDFSLAGVHIRYQMDIYPFIIFIALANILILDSLINVPYKKIIYFSIIFIVIIISFVIFFNILGSGTYYVRDLSKASLLEKFIKNVLGR